VGRSSAAHSICPLAAVHRREVGDKGTRIVASRDVSQISAAPLTHISESLFGESIQLARRDILFQLTIPQRSIELNEPFTKGCQILR
jgi:hypothetical protein